MTEGQKGLVHDKLETLGLAISFGTKHIHPVEVIMEKNKQTNKKKKTGVPTVAPLVKDLVLSLRQHSGLSLAWELPYAWSVAEKKKKRKKKAQSFIILQLPSPHNLEICFSLSHLLLYLHLPFFIPLHIHDT